MLCAGQYMACTRSRQDWTADAPRPAVHGESHQATAIAEGCIFRTEKPLPVAGAIHRSERRIGVTGREGHREGGAIGKESVAAAEQPHTTVAGEVVGKRASGSPVIYHF